MLGEKYPKVGFLDYMIVLFLMLLGISILFFISDCPNLHSYQQGTRVSFFHILINTSEKCCLENSMDGGAWWAVVHGVSKSRTRLSDLTFTFHFHALEKEMATHSSVLAWRIPGMVEPSGLLSLGSHRVGHNWSDL